MLFVTVNNSREGMECEAHNISQVEHSERSCLRRIYVNLYMCDSFERYNVHVCSRESIHRMNYV